MVIKTMSSREDFVYFVVDYREFYRGGFVVTGLY